MNATTNLASLVKANLSTDIIRMNGSSNSLILNNDISAWIKSQKKTNWRTLQRNPVDLGNASIRDLGQVPTTKPAMRDA